MIIDNFARRDLQGRVPYKTGQITQRVLSPKKVVVVVVLDFIIIGQVPSIEVVIKPIDTL